MEEKVEEESRREDKGSTNQNIQAQIADLERERLEKAQAEIQAICDKYGVTLQGLVTLSATDKRVVPRR